MNEKEARTVTDIESASRAKKTSFLDDLQLGQVKEPGPSEHMLAHLLVLLRLEV